MCSDPHLGLRRYILSHVEVYMETPLIEFRDVTKSFDEKTILDKANLADLRKPDYDDHREERQRQECPP